jgi:hypothetical protein
MRKLAVLGGLLGGAVLLAIVALTDPWVTEKVVQWRCPQATENCWGSMRAMGHMWSGKDNWERARYWYSRPAEAGDAASMFHVAWLYEQDADGVAPATAEYLAVLRELEAEPPPAENRKAAENLASAFEWYRRSAEKGYAPAMNNLGQMYFHGLGTARDLAEAFRWHMAAAREGNPAGAMNVALAYHAGAGVPRDLAEAERWSTWTPGPNTPGLAEPTLGRMRVFGSTLPPDRRALIRAAAEKAAPVTMAMKPLQPDSRIPTFDSVRKKLENQHAE